MVNDVLAGRYRLEEPVATGGMGTVWRAQDQVLQRRVAIKMLHDALADDPAASERFRREALTAAAIGHPHMANVFDYVEDNGRPGIVMEYVDGETLATRLGREGRLPVTEAVRIAIDILTALDAAHEAGIIHRDIKPANILLTPSGHVKVSDFGIARSLSDASLTATGTVMGTAHYSAPEQVRGEFTTPATDLYAVGIVLYEMLTGQRPFTGDTQIAIAMARLESIPEPPRSLRPPIPASLDAAVMRALARDPEERFASAAEMRAALLDTTGAITAIDPATASIPIAAAAETIAYRPPAGAPVRSDLVPPRWAGRRVVALLLPLLLIGLASFWLLAASRSPETPLLPPAAANEPSSSPRAVTTCCRVPSLKGLTLSAAQTALERADLRLGRFIRDEYSATVPRDRVLRTVPPAGTRLAEGEPVNYVLSKGPAPKVTEERDDNRDTGNRGKGRKTKDGFLRGVDRREL